MCCRFRQLEDSAKAEVEKLADTLEHSAVSDSDRKDDSSTELEDPFEDTDIDSFGFPGFFNMFNTRVSAGRQPWWKG